MLRPKTSGWEWLEHFLHDWDGMDQDGTGLVSAGRKGEIMAFFSPSVFFSFFSFPVLFIEGAFCFLPASTLSAVDSTSLFFSFSFFPPLCLITFRFVVLSSPDFSFFPLACNNPWRTSTTPPQLGKVLLAVLFFFFCLLCFCTFIASKLPCFFLFVLLCVFVCLFSLVCYLKKNRVLVCVKNTSFAE